MTTPEASKILGLPPFGGTVEAVKAAFRRLVKSAHPDLGGSDREFIRLKAAYDVLLGVRKPEPARRTPPPPRPVYIDPQDVAESMLDELLGVSNNVNDWEFEFICDMDEKRHFTWTEKQIRKVREIHRRYCRFARAS